MERPKPAAAEYRPQPFSQAAASSDAHAHCPSLPEIQSLEKQGIIFSAGQSERAIAGEERTSRLRLPYDRALDDLGKVRAKLGEPNKRALSTAEPSGVLPSATPLVCYETGIGSLNFEALHEKSRKYAAFVLHHSYQVHPGDVNDGLQAGYMHLWKRLEQTPTLLMDKPMAWIAKGIVYKALHTLRQDRQQHTHQVLGEGHTSTDNRGGHSRESRQTDIRVDIHQAIAQVAQAIIEHQKGKQATYDIWALYGLTMLQANASTMSRLFRVREQSMQAAYQRVQEQLKAALPQYAPLHQTKPAGKHGPEALPRPDMTAVRQSNAGLKPEVYTAVQKQIQAINADTRSQDELALEGIRQGVSISTQAREHQVPQHQMQRAYKRVHLMLAAHHDPNVRILRPERRVKHVFTLTAESAIAVHDLAQRLLKQAKSYEKLVALHTHISNLAISTTAKHFNLPTSTLRYYAKQIASELLTPTVPARKEIRPVSEEDVTVGDQKPFNPLESAAD